MIHRSILALRFGCRTLSDPNSRKKDRIAFFESLFLKNPVASSKLVTDTVENPAWSLNLHHETWCNPCLLYTSHMSRPGAAMPCA